MCERRSITVFLLMFFFGAGAFFLFTPSLGFSHCQIPCGIYGDDTRFELMYEDAKTIEKSMRVINELAEKKTPDYNQIVRWVRNKDDHAEKLSNIVTYYFMAQRVKPVSQTDGKAYKDYVAKITLLHHILVYAMKTKQSTDPATVEKLRSAIGAFKIVYTSGH